MLRFLQHLFLPHHSNNHRPKLLHLSSLFLIAFFLFVATYALSVIKDTQPQVLGSAADISSNQLLLLTNQERLKAGVSPLSYNDLLAQAARAKAADMFAKNYWAHVSPTGTQPWFFITQAGYKYVYAGENLARGYGDADSTVQAWMASPSHRANLLSSNYTEVGFAIEQGTLTGEPNTILVVEMFGGPRETKGSVALEVPKAAAAEPEAKIPTEHIVRTPTIDRFSFAKNLTQILVGLFVLLFILDIIFIERKKISRLVGHNLDHILFLTGILILIILLRRGSIF